MEVVLFVKLNETCKLKEKKQMLEEVFFGRCRTGSVVPNIFFLCDL